MGLLVSHGRILGVLIFFIVICNALAAQRAKSAEQTILERIFADRTYDQRVRPVTSSNASAPVFVTVNLYLRSVDTLDDKNHQYSVQLTYRQKWRDERLSFSRAGDIQQISLINPHNQIWRPDTFFSNEKEGKYHELMSRNEFVRLSPNGDIMQSSRISLRLLCPMNFRYFPLDSQTCHIRLASYGYTTSDLVFKWEMENPVQISQNLIIPNFSLKTFETSYCDSTTTTGSYSCLLVAFTFKRVFSPYLLNVYIPSTMFVLVSWFSFWVSAEAMTSRLLLTALTLFVLAIQTADANKQFPLTSYTKAVDTWTGICLTFVLAALVEFIVVHYISRKQKNGSNSNISLNKDELLQQVDEEANVEQMSQLNPGDEEEQEIPLKDLSLNDGKQDENGEDEKKKKIPEKTAQQLKKRVLDYCKRYMSGFHTLPEKIDGASRVLFPIAFFIFNVFYWIGVRI